MSVRWSEQARAHVRSFLTDQGGMHAVVAAVAALGQDPTPPGAFVRGEYARLRVGDYRVFYVILPGEIRVDRVDRAPSPPR